MRLNYTKSRTNKLNFKFGAHSRSRNHLKETHTLSSSCPTGKRCQNDEAAFGAGCCRYTSTRPTAPPSPSPSAQVSFIFILLYSCFSGRLCGTRTDIRLTNNAVPIPSPSSLVSLSPLSVAGQIDVRQPTLEIALSGRTAAMQKDAAPGTDGQQLSQEREREIERAGNVRVDSLATASQRGIMHAYNVL